MMFQVPSHHLLPQAQVSSFHHLPHPQVTSPHLLPETQASSPNYLSHPPLPSPHLQVTSPHLLPQTQANSPHPHLPHPASPHLTSPHFEPQPQVTLPHLLSPSQQHLYNQNHLLGLDDPNWGGSDPPLEPSFPHLSYTYQNQTSTHLDFQNQTQFGDDLQSLSYNVHTLFDRGVDRQVDTPGPAQDAWQPLESPLPQFQCSSLGPVSREVPLGGWSSEDFSSSPSGNFNQFFQEGYYDNSAPQPFCSPNTPGPSPHYPQTPTISSPGPQMIPREERVDFNTHTPRSLSGDTTISCFSHTCDSLPVTSDPHQTHQHLLQSHTKLIQDQTAPLDTTRTTKSCFSLQKTGREVRSTAQSPGVTAGPSWRVETGGGGGGGGRGRGGQTSWTTIKQPRNSTKAPDPRLLCMVCKRDFRSLPALNGHMRSHSGSRSAAGSTKVNDSTPRGNPSVSMVIPVSVPIQSRSVLEACGGGQKSCSHLSSTTGGAALYRSLLHPQEEKADANGDAVVAGGDDAGVRHYTPPPMLCPLRAGPGLFCSLTTRGQQLHSGLCDVVAMETSALTPGTNMPRINLGRDNQAEIPPLQVQNDAHSDSHNALLVWRPMEELEHPVNQQSVEALMLMACSSVMPGGGASPETALQVLSECRGDFLLTVEKLLSNNNHTAQQSPSVCWSAAERRLLLKSLQLHRKDFRNIQKTVQTKSLSQCVEFYYLWKKKLSLRTKAPAGLTITLPDTNGQRRSKSHDAP